MKCTYSVCCLTVASFLTFRKYSWGVATWMPDTNLSTTLIHTEISQQLQYFGLPNVNSGTKSSFPQLNWMNVQLCKKEWMCLSSDRTMQWRYEQCNIFVAYSTNRSISGCKLGTVPKGGDQCICVSQKYLAMPWRSRWDEPWNGRSCWFHKLSISKFS